MSAALLKIGRTIQQQAAEISKVRKWTGRILSALAVLFLLMDGVMKVLKPPSVVEATVQLRYAASRIVGIGMALLICTALYLIPRNTVWERSCSRGYLGGAVASNVRAGAPAFNMAFPILFGVLVWVSLVLGDRCLEDIFFARK